MTEPEVPDYSPTGQARLRLREHGVPVGVTWSFVILGLAGMARAGAAMFVILLVVLVVALVVLIPAIERRAEAKLPAVGPDGVLFTCWASVQLDTDNRPATSSRLERPSGRVVTGILEIRSRALRVRVEHAVPQPDPAIGFTEVADAQIIPARGRHLGWTALVLGLNDGTWAWLWLKRPDLEQLRGALWSADVQPARPAAAHD